MTCCKAMTYTSFFAAPLNLGGKIYALPGTGVKQESFFNRFIKQDLSLADDETNKNANPEPDFGPGC